MGQFDVDQTENGFAAPKKVESGRFASCKIKVKNISETLGCH